MESARRVGRRAGPGRWERFRKIATQANDAGLVPGSLPPT